MDSVGSSGAGYFPQMQNIPPHNHDGTGGMHVYVPWWKYDRKNDFPRGYHIEMGGGRDMPGVGDFHELCDDVEGYGLCLKQTIRKNYGTVLGVYGPGARIQHLRLSQYPGTPPSICWKRRGKGICNSTLWHRPSAVATF